MTSANVTYYQLWKGDKYIGEESQNCMCKTTIMQRLAKYQPVEEYDIIARWPDENEADHYTERLPLKDVLNGKKLKWKEYEY